MEQAAAKEAAKAEAENRLREQFGEGAAGEAMALLGEDGMPDQSKLKAKAQGYFTNFFGSKVEELTSQLIDEEASSEYQVCIVISLSPSLVFSVYVLMIPTVSSSPR